LKPEVTARRFQSFVGGCYHSTSIDETLDSQTSEDSQMDQLTRRVLHLFAQMNSETLDLHTLFEAGGNDPQAREQVFDIVSRLVREGLLEERGSDFYAITDSGRAAIHS
jgi:DNA-binding PadR family transcriptional regulator